MSKGFSLLEILVVALIIGVLASFAVSDYQKAVERSTAKTLRTANTNSPYKFTRVLFRELSKKLFYLNTV